MTRARDALNVYFPLRYYRRPRGLEDGHSYAQLSRFLPEAVLSWFDRRALSPADEETLGGRRLGGVPQVESFLARLWE